jgi:hypothetical protein
MMDHMTASEFFEGIDNGNGSGAAGCTHTSMQDLVRKIDAILVVLEAEQSIILPSRQSGESQHPYANIISLNGNGC